MGISKDLTVGQLAARSGLAVSALHFYEAKGLISSWRSKGNQRRYPREMLRRVALIKVAQRMGVPLAAILEVLNSLPTGRAPTTNDWKIISTAWKSALNERIDNLIRLRDSLSDCIGCGCLSLKICPLRNPMDRLAQRGPGPQLLVDHKRKQGKS